MSSPQLPNAGSPQTTLFGSVGRLVLSALCLIGVYAYASNAHAEGGHMLVIAAVIGAYMAMNIGANDVANNVGPAIGARALTLFSAIIIAGIFEAAGAIIAGGDVVGTVKSDIISPEAIANPDVFVWLMTAALLAGALWLNLATAIGAPVSTTHSIVGGVLGAGIAAGGWGVANWPVMGEIAMSWVVSPVLGGLVAAGFLYFIKRTITYRADMRAAALKVVPLLTALMTWAFTAYICTKGIKHLVKIDMTTAMGIGVVTGVIAWFVMRPLVSRAASRLANDKEGVNKLFTIPLICSAALLSFAHGANDVANAIGPLAGIHEVLTQHAVAAKASVPLWIMVVGALGIVAGLTFYGPRLIRTVGSEITELDQMRAFCIAMAAALTVLIASHLGLPVSSTHIAVGGVFGVGFLRELLKARYARAIEEIEAHHQGEDRQVVEEFLAKFEAADIVDQGRMLEELKRRSTESGKRMLSKGERKGLKKAYQNQLVKRSILLKIITAWVITVPASGLLAAMLYFTIRGMSLP